MTTETTAEAAPVNWRRWIERWDAMQTAYLPYREERFTVMLGVLDNLMAESFVAVDLASGPGAISQRLLARFPQARCVAIDYDPALLALGRGALGDAGGRLRWVEADLRDPNWIQRLGERRVDAVLSTTALHWLDVSALTRLYSQLGELIRPGGVFLNGDHLPFAPHLPTFRALAEAYTNQRREKVFDAQASQQNAEDWRAWWGALAAEPGMAALVAERERRFSSVSETPHATGVTPAEAGAGIPSAAQGGDEAAPLGELHEAALRNAGFQEVGVIWRTLDDGVLLGVR